MFIFQLNISYNIHFCYNYNLIISKNLFIIKNLYKYNKEPELILTAEVTQILKVQIVSTPTAIRRCPILYFEMKFDICNIDLISLTIKSTFRLV